NLASFRELMSYGSITFIIIVAEQLRFQADAVIIGIFLSASAITAFSIGSRLADYAVEPVESMASIFLPMASHFEATKTTRQLCRCLNGGKPPLCLHHVPNLRNGGDSWQVLDQRLGGSKIYGKLPHPAAAAGAQEPLSCSGGFQPGPVWDGPASAPGGD